MGDRELRERLLFNVPSHSGRTREARPSTSTPLPLDLIEEVRSRVEEEGARIRSRPGINENRPDVMDGSDVVASQDVDAEEIVISTESTHDQEMLVSTSDFDGEFIQSMNEGYMAGLEARLVQLDRLLTPRPGQPLDSVERDGVQWYFTLLKDEITHYERIGMGIRAHQAMDMILPSEDITSEGVADAEIHSEFLRRPIVRRLMIVKRQIKSFLSCTLAHIEKQMDKDLRMESVDLIEMFQQLVHGSHTLEDAAYLNCPFELSPPNDESMMKEGLQLLTTSPIPSKYSKPLSIPLSVSLGHYVATAYPTMVQDAALKEIMVDGVFGFENGNADELDFVKRFSKRAINILPVTKAVKYLLNYFKDLAPTAVGGHLSLVVLNAIRRIPMSPSVTYEEGSVFRSLLSTLYLQFVILCFIEGELAFQASSLFPSPSSASRKLYRLVEQAITMKDALWGSPDRAFMDDVMLMSVSLTTRLWKEEGFDLDLGETTPFVPGQGPETLLNCLIYLALYGLMSEIAPHQVPPVTSESTSPLMMVLHTYASVTERLMMQELVQFSDERSKNLILDPENALISTLVPAWSIQALVWRLLVINQQVLSKAEFICLLGSGILRHHSPVSSNIDLMKRRGLTRSLLYAMITLCDPEDIIYLKETLLRDEPTVTSVIICLTLRAFMDRCSDDVPILTDSKCQEFDASLIIQSMTISVKQGHDFGLLLLRDALVHLYQDEALVDGWLVDEFGEAPQILRVLVTPIDEEWDEWEGSRDLNVDETPWSVHPSNTAGTINLTLAKIVCFIYLMLLKGQKGDEADSLDQTIQKMPKLLRRGIEKYGMGQEVAERVSEFLQTLSNSLPKLE